MNRFLLWLILFFLPGPTAVVALVLFPLVRALTLHPGHARQDSRAFPEIPGGLFSFPGRLVRQLVLV